jgi:MtN3 and saliva related transmembrane protein
LDWIDSLKSRVKVHIESMNNKHMMENFWFLIGSSAALLTMFGFVPQVIKMYRTKIVRDLSLWMLVQFTIGVSLWMLYGIHIRDPIIVFANVTTLIILLISIALYLLYRNNSVNQKQYINRDEK